MIGIPEQAEELIRQFEGCSLTAYEDTGGKRTIGIGHLLKPGETETIISEEQAEYLLAQDLQSAAQAIKDHVTVPLNENQFSALLSLVFNCGPGPLTGGLGRCLNAGDYAGCSQRFILWNNIRHIVSQGLSNRRKAEQQLFDTPPDA